MKYKIYLAAVFLLMAAALDGLWPSGAVYAASFSTKAQCSGNALTVSATAPSSVTPSATFSVTNVSSTSTAPNGITVNRIVSTSSLTYASPTTVNGTWTGAGTGTFTAQFPSFNLSASGAAGTKIKMALNRIDLYVNGGSSPVTCSVANGQLTANAPGESLTIFNIAITAPPTTGGGIVSQAPPPASAAKPTTPTPHIVASVTPPAAPASPPAAVPNVAQPLHTPVPVVAKKQLTVVVRDSGAYVLSGIKVGLDSKLFALTNTQGEANFKNLSEGHYKITVFGPKETLTRSVTVDTKTTSPMTVVVQMPKTSHSMTKMLGMATGSVFVVLLVVIGIWISQKRRVQPGALSTGFVTPAPANPPTVIQPQPTIITSVPASSPPPPAIPQVLAQPAPAALAPRPSGFQQPGQVISPQASAGNVATPPPLSDSTPTTPPTT